jgi:hypothetical protein
MKVVQTGLDRDTLLMALAEMPPHTHYVTTNGRGDTVYCNVCDCHVKDGTDTQAHYEVTVVRPPQSHSILGLIVELAPDAKTFHTGAESLYDFLMLLGACYIRPEMTWDQVELDRADSPDTP